ncbi:phage tail tube protein [Streptomyces sp. NPDC017940]|uniref:phage tail tube protein n=1 Tax=Streptomyces sp. NPDC017940 TaxID=3365017 RepID=UPI0037AC4917
MSTPTPPAETETALARRYRLELNTGTTTPTWSLVPGVQEFAPKVEPTQQKSTTYDDEGWADSTVTELAWSIETKLAHRCHPETRVFNAAQERLRLASESFGAASRVHVRYYDREGRDEAYEGYALVTWEPEGGAPDDLDTVKVTLTGKGPRKKIANPLAPPAGGTLALVAEESSAAVRKKVAA